MFTSVPFKSESGLTQVNGVAKFSSAGIILEFESKLFGIIRDGVKEVRLAVDDILDVKFRKGVFRRSAKIEIRTKTFSKLVEVPNSDGKITLNLLRDDMERGESAVLQLQKDLAEHSSSKPPPRTPLTDLFDDDIDEETAQLKKEK